MNNFKALSIAGLLAGSLSANAAFIVNLPERVSFDINAPISSFTLDHVYDLDWDNPNTNVELVEHNISIGGFVDLPTTESFPLDSFYGPETVNDGLKALLFGRLKEDPNNPGQAIRNGGVLPYVELG